MNTIRRTSLTKTAAAIAALLAVSAISSAAIATERDIGPETRGQVAAICAGLGGHYEKATTGAYGCEGPGHLWNIICTTSLSCLIETGIAPSLTQTSDISSGFGASLGLHNTGGSSGGTTTNGPTGNSGGSGGGSGGCICNQIGGGGGNTNPVTPPSSPVGTGVIGGTVGRAH